MKTLFDSINDTPSRRLLVRQTVVLDRHTNDETFRLVQERMAQQLARTILESEKFFQSRAHQDIGVPAVEFVADCIVLTQDEYSALHRKIFREGFEHAMYYAPPTFEPR